MGRQDGFSEGAYKFAPTPPHPTSDAERERIWLAWETETPTIRESFDAGYLAARAADAEEIARMRADQPLCDGGCGPDGPEETCSLHGRPVAEVWAIVRQFAEERDALAQRFDSLDELFLHMRDRVAGYMNAPPVARFFHNGAAAFEWAATNVRRARDGEPLLDPPVPGSKPSPVTPEDETNPDECPACDTPLDGCSPDAACCEDCNHTACWPSPVTPEELTTIRQEIADTTGYTMRNGKAWAPCTPTPVTPESETNR